MPEEIDLETLSSLYSFVEREFGFNHRLHRQFVGAFNFADLHEKNRKTLRWNILVSFYYAFLQGYETFTDSNGMIVDIIPITKSRVIR